MLNYKKKLLEVPPVGSREKKPVSEVPSKVAPSGKPAVAVSHDEGIDRKLETLRKSLLSDLERDLEGLRKQAVPAPGPAKISKGIGPALFFAAILAGVLSGVGGFAGGVRWMDARLKPDWQKELAEIQQQASLKLDRFFSSRETQVFLETRAAEQVKQQVGEKASSAIQEQLTALTAATQAETGRMKDETAAALASLQELAAFDLLVTQAKNDDRKAFDRLLEVSRDRNHRFREVAGNAISQIFLETTSREKLARQSEPGTQAPSAYLSFEAFAAAYEAAIPLRRQEMLTGLWKSDQFSLFQKLDFLMKVIRTDTSLLALARACALVDEKASLGLPFTAHEKYLDWWGENRQFFQASV